MDATMLNDVNTADGTHVPSSCPMHAHRAPAELSADEELGFPNHKRLVTEYLTDEAGARELHLYYGEKEVVFDEPELFVFGETLAQHPRFVAGEAVQWCPAADWPRVREMLEHLLDEGILRRAAELDTELTGARPSPLPAAQCQTPRTWFECEAIARELTGEPLDPAYLELVVPVYRVAHIFLDGEGRQVGEANVFPSQLRLDIPTDWRVCPHAGSRYRDDMPMNVTALKSMRVHWQQCMVLLKKIRAAFLQRFPHIERKGWTVGDLERLSSLVLTVPAYQLLRLPNPVPNGELHPVLSSMYRVTDGVRLTMHHMLFIPTNEPTLPGDAPMNAAELFSYAERNAVFLSEFGVCAGPNALIHEFLRVLIDGEAVPGEAELELDPPLVATLREIEQAFDYGLYGLQAHAVTFSLWSALGRAYEKVWRIVESWPSTGPQHYVQFREQLQRNADRLARRSFVGTEAGRLSRDHAFTNMFDNCALGLGARSSAASLAQCLRYAHEPQHAQAAVQLQSLLQRQLLAVQLPGGAIAALSSALIDSFQQEQAVVRASAAIADRIGALLGRPAAARPLTVADIRLFYQLDDERRRPPLFAVDLEQTLGIRVAVSGAAITVSAVVTATENETAAQRALHALQRDGMQRLAKSLHGNAQAS